MEDEKKLVSRAYMCGTDIRYEMQTPEMSGDCKITPNKDYALATWHCTRDECECGLAEVEVRFVRWVRTPIL